MNFVKKNQEISEINKENQIPIKSKGPFEVFVDDFFVPMAIVATNIVDYRFVRRIIAIDVIGV